MTNTNSDLIIKRIKSLCKDKKISAYQVAKNGEMNPSTLNNILSGRFKDPRISTLKKICVGLNISIKDFFNDKIFN